MKKEEAFMGAVAAPALLATLGFPERWNRGLLASSSEIPGGEFSPQWWPLKCGCGQCILRLLVNLAIEQPHLLEQPQRSWVQDRMGFYGTLFRWWGSRFFFPNPFQIYPRVAEGTSACGQEATHTRKWFPRWHCVSQEQLFLWSRNWRGDGSLEFLMGSTINPEANDRGHWHQFMSLCPQLSICKRKVVISVICAWGYWKKQTKTH